MSGTGVINEANYGEIFRSFSQKRKSGTLEITIGSETIRVAFYSGKIIDAVKLPGTAADQIKEWLVQACLIPANTPIDQEMGYGALMLFLAKVFPDIIDEGLFRSVVTQRVLEVLFSLHFKTGGFYTFRYEVPSVDKEAAPSISASQFLLDMVTFEADTPTYNAEYSKGTCLKRSDRTPGALTGDELLVYELLEEPLEYTDLKSISLLSEFALRDAILTLKSDGFIIKGNANEATQSVLVPAALFSEAALAELSGDMSGVPYGSHDSEEYDDSFLDEVEGAPDESSETEVLTTPEASNLYREVADLPEVALPKEEPVTLVVEEQSTTSIEETVLQKIPVICPISDGENDAAVEDDEEEVEIPVFDPPKRGSIQKAAEESTVPEPLPIPAEEAALPVTLESLAQELPKPQDDAFEEASEDDLEDLEGDDDASDINPDEYEAADDLDEEGDENADGETSNETREEKRGETANEIVEDPENAPSVAVAEELAALALTPPDEEGIGPLRDSELIQTHSTITHQLEAEDEDDSECDPLVDEVEQESAKVDDEVIEELPSEPVTALLQDRIPPASPTPPYEEEASDTELVSAPEEIDPLPVLGDWADDPADDNLDIRKNKSSETHQINSDPEPDLVLEEPLETTILQQVALDPEIALEEEEESAFENELATLDDDELDETFSANGELSTESDETTFAAEEASPPLTSLSYRLPDDDEAESEEATRDDQGLEDSNETSVDEYELGDEDEEPITEVQKTAAYPSPDKDEDELPSTTKQRILPSRSVERDDSSDETDDDDFKPAREEEFLSPDESEAYDSPEPLSSEAHYAPLPTAQSDDEYDGEEWNWGEDSGESAEGTGREATLRGRTLSLRDPGFLLQTISIRLTKTSLPAHFVSGLLLIAALGVPFFKWRSVLATFSGF